MIGIDIVEVARFREMKERKAFLRKFFSESERQHAGEDPARMAGIWAAKEAVAKALGTGFRGLNPGQIEILYTDSGMPYAKVGETELELSVSHEREYAVAVAQRR